MTTLANLATMPGVLEKATDGISVKEAADRFGVTRATIQNWVAKGDLPATRFGAGKRSIIRIAVEDLEKLRRQA